MISDDRLRERLTVLWGLSEPTVEPHHGGMNSATWFVEADGVRWVAKAVAPDQGRSFAAGLAVAARIDEAGIPSGAPMPTSDGPLTAEVDGVPLALLAHVPGEPLGDSPADQAVLGSTLGKTHLALKEVDVAGTEAFHWIDTDAEHLDVRPWVRGAVAAAVSAFDGLGPETLTYGHLHSDPAPEAFLLDPVTGRCGLIDWPTALRGPLLYDLASAAMYVGGPDRAAPLLDAYAAEGPLGRDEIERGLDVLLRFRWGVQADYFARRIAAGDLTGIADEAGNERGLADAEHRLARFA
jgi:Ser/Thr protein kinase RdoA (MazF antagonist)